MQFFRLTRRTDSHLRADHLLRPGLQYNQNRLQIPETDRLLPDSLLLKAGLLAVSSQDHLRFRRTDSRQHGHHLRVRQSHRLLLLVTGSRHQSHLVLHQAVRQSLQAAFSQGHRRMFRQDRLRAVRSREQSVTRSQVQR